MTAPAPEPPSSAPARAPGRVRTVALDAMGGDHAPHAPLRAAAAISRATDIRLLVVGDRAVTEPFVARVGAASERIELLHAPDHVRMDESPRAALGRSDSSLARGVEAVAAGRADALVSAGNTGALLLHAARAIPRLPGVRRAALAAVYPTLPRPHNADPFALLLDVGANLESTPSDLLQFAAMGSAYAARISKVSRPSVGLLNIGEESFKGDPVLREAHALLSRAPHLDFRGNVEGRDVPLGAVDVVVCPGVVGNVVLKLLESMGEVLVRMGDAVYAERLRWRAGRFLLRDGLARVSNLLDYASYGGAPILGFAGIVIKAHGRSREPALENAIKIAAKAVRDDVCGAIAERLGRAQGAQPSGSSGWPSGSSG
jgi:glycerol-3-phosphate acyltransferase PlsX